MGASDPEIISTYRLGFLPASSGKRCPAGVFEPARSGPKCPSCGRLTGRTPLHYPADLRTYTMGSCVPQAKYSFAVILPYDGWGSWGPVVRARKL